MRDNKGRFVKGHKLIKGSERGWFKKGHLLGKRFSKDYSPGIKFKKGECSSPETEFKKGFKPWNKGKSGYSLPSRGKSRPQTSGNKNGSWKGGKTKTAEYIRFTNKYENWRKKVFERDKFTCQECGKIGGFIEAHHIKPQSIFPKSRFVLSNGRTLCKQCHRKTDTYGWKMVKKLLKEDF